MPELASKSQCTGCTACVSICPCHCTKMQKDDAGFLFPEMIERSACIGCGACEQVCSVLADEGFDGELSTVAYAAFSKNNLLRMGSSSGGFFSELADAVLQSGGLVYGVGYDAEGTVKHICVGNQKELGKLRGAKYSQSILGDSFQTLKKQLDSGRKVLFSGTPCQVAGLQSFLKRDYDNLICVDFVCHGVPSPMVWEKYIKYRAQNDNGGVTASHINLRNKESGWSKYSYSVEFTYSDNNRYLCENSADPFIRLFVGDYILRESCSDCRFKGYSRVSDITLGDFWGIWDIAPEMDDNEGTSLVLTHSKKGKRLFDMLAENINFKQVTLEQASRMNPSLLESSVHHSDREKVLEAIFQGSFEDALPILNASQVNKGVKEYLNRIFNKFWRFK